MAKINPKMAKKQTIFDFFRFSQKLFKRLEGIFQQTFYAIIESHMFNGIKFVWLWGEKWAKFSPKTVKKPSFFDFFQFSQKLSIPFERLFLQSFHAILWSFMCNFIKFGWWDVRNVAKINRRGPKINRFLFFFWFSRKLSIRFERNFVQSFYTILWCFVCYFIKFVLLRCKQHNQSQPKNGQKTVNFRLFWFLQKLSIRFDDNFYSRSTTYYGPLCAISINSYSWDVRNVAKINPKMSKKQPFFDFFDFRENCSNDSNWIWYSPSTLYYGVLCVISTSLYCCDANNIIKVSPKMVKKQSIFDFFDFCKNCPFDSTIIFTVVLQHIMVLYVQFQ